jgi:hypothetical protein
VGALLGPNLHQHSPSRIYFGLISPCWVFNPFHPHALEQVVKTEMLEFMKQLRLVRIGIAHLLLPAFVHDMKGENVWNCEVLSNFEQDIVV